MSKPIVAFVCVHNSCRSQIAEAIGTLLASDVFISLSAGTEVVDQINQDAVRLMKVQYQVDMEETQYSKHIRDIGAVDIVITMGCNVACPALPAKYREDWGLVDPTGHGDAAFLQTIATIEAKILDLKGRIERRELLVC